MGQGQSYHELFECSPDAILIIEGDRFVDCNPAAVKMLRFPSKEDLLERYSGAKDRGGLSAHPADISPPTQPDGRNSFEKAEEYLAITFERGSHTFEWAHLCADGEVLLVEVQLTVVRRGEKPVLHVGWRDISERKRLEAELRRAQRLEAVGRLAGGVAHDFNNLLAVILSHTELLEQGFGSDAPGSQHIEGIRSAADRAADLTRQLLAFSRGQPAQSRPIDLGNLVEELSGLLRRLIGEHIELNLQRESESLTVVADPSQLEQLVLNLCANARDAMPGGGCLEVFVGRRLLRPSDVPGQLPVGEYVLLRVTDTGTGMDQQELERAFDPFYTTKSLGKGTGLGLATVHAIAEQNGGNASIESTIGVGTTVHVLLPVSDRKPVELEQAPMRKRSVPGGGETILLVEDEPEIRDLYKESLKTKGYRVLTAGDGQEALELVTQSDESIDLVVTDVVMPRLSGPRMVRRLSQILPRLKVLYMSGYSEEKLSDLSDEQRAVVLQKPFAPKLLESEVRNILDRESEASGCYLSALL